MSTLDGPLVCLVLTVAHIGYAELACTEPASLAAMAVMMSHGLLTIRMVAFLGIGKGNRGSWRDVRLSTVWFLGFRVVLFWVRDMTRPLALCREKPIILTTFRIRSSIVQRLDS